ncbi:MAG TPA: TMEM175 family protein [Candidatus Dormibacteraeota bacterium]|nr:TMEM175 family protein [Candidatus Dormibacteraeota bacterium]
MRPSRAEAFSDGVMAIAITLLVLDLRVPRVEHGLGAALLAQWPSYATYVISFLTVGIIWLNHHMVFDRLRRVDRPLLLANLVLLLVVALVPFTTQLLAAYLVRPEQGVAGAIYGANMAAMGTVFGGMWWYALRRGGLLARPVTRAEARASIARFAVGNPLYALAIVLGFLDVRIGIVLYAAVAAYYAAFVRLPHVEPEPA